MASMSLVAMVLVMVPCAAISMKSARDVSGSSDRPVSRVVKLLKAMKVEFEQDFASDGEEYDRVKCWCKKNDDERMKSITDAEARIEDLFSTVKEAASRSGTLKAEIKGLQDQLSDMTESLAKATEIRKQETSLFTEEEKETIDTVKALKSAIEAIERQHAAIAQGKVNSSLLVTPDVKNVLSMLRLKMQSNGRVLLANTKPHERRILKAFMQSPEGEIEDMVQADAITKPHERRILKAFMQSPEDDEFEDMVEADAPVQADASKKNLGLVGFAPRSGTILGILRTMLEDFEKNLSESQQKEMANQEEYEAMKASKEKEIASCADRIAKKQEELADYDETSAQANEDLIDTRGARSADTKYLQELKLHCQMTDSEWGIRSKVWQEMIYGVSKTIAALDNDDAKDTFTDAFHSSNELEPANERLLQVHEAFQSKALMLFQMRSLRGQSSKLDHKRAQAAQVLTMAARAVHSPALLKIASSVKLDAFEKVKAAIDGMIAELSKQQQDEVKHKDFCNQGLHDNDVQTVSSVRDKRDAEAKLADLKSKIETLDTEIEALKADIVDLEAARKKASDLRALEKNFHRIISNQQRSQRVLNKALDLLKGQAPGHQEAFSGFLQQPQSAAHKPVIALLEHIVKSSKAIEDATRKAEEEAKEKYRKMVEEIQATIDEKQVGIMNRSEDRAKAVEEKAALEQTESEITSEIEKLGFEKADLHESCDFILKNFDIRQEARAQEMEALRKANAILSSAKFDSFLQGLT